MSTASPDTCADVAGVATQRAASASEPYLRTAWRRSCCWYSAERQPLSTTRPTPSAAAAVAARRNAPCSAGSSLATPGIASSKTVVPAGTAPSASPRAPWCTMRRTALGDGIEDEDVVRDEAGSLEPRAAAIAAMTRSRPARRALRIRWGPAVVRAGWLEVTPASQRGVALPARMAVSIRRRYAAALASEHARAARRGRALHGRGHPRRPTPRGHRGGHRRRRRRRAAAVDDQRLRHRRPGPRRPRALR